MEVVYRKISLTQIGEYRKFFRQCLEREDQRNFMPHPDWGLLSLVFYAGMWVQQCLGKAVYELAYNGENEPVGMIVLRAFKHNKAELGVAVSKLARGQGLGKILMQTIEQRAQTMSITELELSVMPDNQPAIALYQSMGYEKTGEVQITTLTGEDRTELTMIKVLSE